MGGVGGGGGGGGGDGRLVTVKVLCFGNCASKGNFKGTHDQCSSSILPDVLRRSFPIPLPPAAPTAIVEMGSTMASLMAHSLSSLTYASVDVGFGLRRKRSNTIVQN